MGADYWRRLAARHARSLAAEGADAGAATALLVAAGAADGAVEQLLQRSEYEQAQALAAAAGAGRLPAAPPAAAADAPPSRATPRDSGGDPAAASLHAAAADVAASAAKLSLGAAAAAAPPPESSRHAGAGEGWEGLAGVVAEGRAESFLQARPPDRGLALAALSPHRPCATPLAWARTALPATPGQAGQPTLAACCHLAHGDGGRAVGALLHAHELEAALALSLALGLHQARPAPISPISD